MKYFIVLWRSILFYFLVTIMYRIMGKREIGELSMMDFTVSLFIAEMAAISIENYKTGIWLSLIPILILGGIQILLSHFSLKNKKIRDIIDGKPAIIIEQGNINLKEMKKQRYNLDDLLIQLRSQSIKSLQEVDYAILENNGKLSIFKKKDDIFHDYPLPIIIDGKIEEITLKRINKTKDWLNQSLKNNHVSLQNVFYGFYQKRQLYIIEKNKIK